ncbi:hypothetical protein Patl1_08146 [Pistacia atlantica]|uniref:Uncharacterized protein n=1 Tax=Pistacia atlantica TaxID=434234 RepID=A0ACC1AGA9_9ROSI|nr:hypothetical protein Patl1_08146 [Pistacia atlantica]
MWSIGIYVLALLIIPITYWILHKWRTCPSNVKLPPGSMGLPFIGETLQFFVPSKSLDIHPFLKTRLHKNGPLFKTSLVGRPVLVSSDPEFSHFILQQEGKLVELWYMDSFVKLVGLSGSVKDGSCIIAGYIHKRLKKLVLDQFGPLNLKEKLLPEVEELVNRALSNWRSQSFVEVKQACAVMIMNFTVREMYGYDPEKRGEIMAEEFTDFFEGLMSLPINIPGTTYHKCLQKQKSALKMMKKLIEERQASSEARRGDLLDLIVDDMKTNKLLTYDLMSYMMFGLLLATFETISTTVTLIMMLLTEHPLVVQGLEKENQEILQSRENIGSKVTWKEFRSMTFTLQVINESLRMGNFVPGFLRRAIKDIHINGYTIPEGWTIMVVPSAIHLNPEKYNDPLTFNPWRWKDLAANVTAKNFIPFGGGVRLCPGVEFSKVLIAVFLHVLVTKYSWSKVKHGEIVRAPIMGFGKGYYIKLAEKLK